jgi:antitoxin (DNA-binding transcriptional repressor) of toxin-antitoxin stability system
MREIGLYQAKTQLSALVAAIETTGETFALTRHGKVIAELRPPARSAPKRGCMKSKPFQMSDDFDSDDLGFEDFWNGPVPPSSSRGKGKSSANHGEKP